MSDSFYCAAPWRGLHINPRGDVKTCCAGDPNMLGNLNTNNIIEILNSDLMADIRNVAIVYKLNALEQTQSASGTMISTKISITRLLETNTITL